MSETNLSGVFVLQEVRERILADVWPKTAPGITTPITSLSTINEGDSVVVNVETTDFEGQTLYWTIQGVTGTINSSDFSDISGSFVVQSNNFGTLTITSLADATTEGTESFVVQIRTDSTSGPIKATSGAVTINDTSIYNAIYGWYGGGGPVHDSLSTVDRITFASDTAIASVRGPLSLARSEVSAIGNSNFGWFGGGILFSTIRSNVTRITFSSDTSSSSSRGSLSSAKQGIDGSSNNDFGWFGGGFISTGEITTVDRITFADDTATASVRGPLNTPRSFLASTGNNNYGWFGGASGTPPPPLSSIERIDFADDTATASTRGSLFWQAKRLSAISNSDYGWFAGGYFSFPFENTLSFVGRINFADDTVTVSSRTTLSFGRSSLGATGNNNYGWFGGGAFPSKSVVERITFDDDTISTSTRGPLSLTRESMGSTSGGV